MRGAEPAPARRGRVLTCKRSDNRLMPITSHSALQCGNRLVTCGFINRKIWALVRWIDCTFGPKRRRSWNDLAHQSGLTQELANAIRKSRLGSIPGISLCIALTSYEANKSFWPRKKCSRKSDAIGPFTVKALTMGKSQRASRMVRRADKMTLLSSRRTV